jgi:TonB-dependent SusC/RagA subfamily outer membrane receptor
MKKISFLLIVTVLSFLLACSSSKMASVEPSVDQSENYNTSSLSLFSRLQQTPGVSARGNEQSMSITIRGANSLSLNIEPLLLINGIPFSGSYSDANKLFPAAKIGKITVLKDPADIGLYGVRGANGVIEVEIKN